MRSSTAVTLATLAGLAGCAPVSNNAVRDAQQPTEDTGEGTPGCPLVFTDSFDDEDGASPPGGWAYHNSNDVFTAEEAGGVVTIDSPYATTRISGEAASQASATNRIVYTVEVVDYIPGGEEANAGIGLTRDTTFSHTIELDHYGNGEAWLDTSNGMLDGSTRNSIARKLGTLPEPPYTLTMRIDADGVQIITDPGEAFSVVPFSDMTNGFAMQAIPEAQPYLKSTNRQYEDVGRLIVDEVRLYVGPDCPAPGD